MPVEGGDSGVFGGVPVGARCFRHPADARVDLGIDGLCEAEEIGRGGFATVFRARQPALDRMVAVKIGSGILDELRRARFEQEGLALGRLSGHPNIVSVHGTGLAAGDRPYIAMDYLRRGSLADQVARYGPLTWPQATRIGIKIAGALESAHRAQTLHRDVKPHNILVSDYGEPLLADFGVALVAGSVDTPTRGIRGSVPYAAPEILDCGRASAASDVYSLAATMYFLLAGEPPFTVRPSEAFLALYLRIASVPPPDLPANAPLALGRLVRAALAKASTERPGSALAFGRALQDVLSAAGRSGADMVVAPEPAAAREDSAGAGPEGRPGARRAGSASSEADTVDDLGEVASRWRAAARLLPGMQRDRSARH